MYNNIFLCRRKRNQNKKRKRSVLGTRMTFSISFSFKFKYKTYSFRPFLVFSFAITLSLCNTFSITHTLQFLNTNKHIFLVSLFHACFLLSLSLSLSVCLSVCFSLSLAFLSVYFTLFFCFFFLFLLFCIILAVQNPPVHPTEMVRVTSLYNMQIVNKEI